MMDRITGFAGLTGFNLFFLYSEKGKESGMFGSVEYYLKILNIFFMEDMLKPSLLKG